VYYGRCAEILEGLHQKKQLPPAMTKSLPESFTMQGLVLRGLGRHAESETALRKARNHRLTLLKLAPKDPQRRLELAQEELRLSGALDNQKKVKEADDARGQGITLLEGLVAEHPKNEVYRSSLSGALIDHAVSLAPRGIAEAGSCFLRAVQLDEGLVKDFPTNAAYHEELALALSNLATWATEHKEPDEAERHLRRSRDVLEQLARIHAREPRYRRKLAQAGNSLGFHFQQQKRHRDAALVFEKAVADWRTLLATAPAAAEDQAGFAQTLVNLADAQTTLGQSGKAEAALLECVALRQRLTQQSPSDTLTRGYLAHNLGTLAKLLQDRGEAEAAGHLLRLAERLKPPAGRR
jgi:tetratricopeptide (TPR) repeat protein